VKLRQRVLPLLLILPALLVVTVLFLVPLGYSLVSAFEETGTGVIGFGNFTKSFEYYGWDTLFTVVITGLATLLIGIFSIAIGGYLVLGGHPRLVAAMRWLYRWPLFIPFIVAAQCMRTFLAKNGLMNNLLISGGLLEPLSAQSFLDWRGILITFVWKQTAFAALLVSGAMASLDPSTIEAARNLGARKLRVLIEIIVPQVKVTVVVGMILSLVTILSVLSVPLMVGTGSPTMLTVDMAFRINSYGDYGVANALGFLTYLLAATVAWFYLRRGISEGGPQ
jgi:putative spermidine/putrescine transport system permease protein